MRLFIAIVPPPEIREILRRAQLGTGGLDPQRIRWTAAENLHMTVKFLGEVPDARIPSLCSALSSADLGEPFALRLTGVIGIPPHKPHRVIAASINGDVGAAKHLAESVDHVCHTMGFPLESRPFVPHITIGRSSRRALNPNAGELESATKECFFGDPTFSVQEIVLMNSILRSTGSEYATVARFSLRKTSTPVESVHARRRIEDEAARQSADEQQPARRPAD